MRSPKPKGSLFLLLIIALIGLALWQKQYIYDEIRLHGYTPSSTVVNLATDATMTDTARRVFYVNKPNLQPQNSFSKYCSNGAEQTVVLGCYKGNQRGIYVLAVTNSELAGIEQVTAAHEMLHAEYDRLSSSKRKHIDNLLQNYYDTKLTDVSIKQVIESYRQTEPNDLVNEMHSIIGSEVPNLPPELETYYQQYFNNRAKVVSYYQAYNDAFTSRQAQIKQYDGQLAALHTQITNLQSGVDNQQKDLQLHRAELNQLRTNNDISAYNAGVAGYNNSVVSYNASVQHLKDLVSSYNQLVDRRNAIAFEEQSLVKAISSPMATQQ